VARWDSDDVADWRRLKVLRLMMAEGMSRGSKETE
jgi:hypothetical protein